jgi:hypothetical protein
MSPGGALNIESDLTNPLDFRPECCSNKQLLAHADRGRAVSRRDAFFEIAFRLRNSKRYVLVRIRVGGANWTPQLQRLANHRTA